MFEPLVILFVVELYTYNKVLLFAFFPSMVLISLKITVTYPL